MEQRAFGLQLFPGPLAEGVVSVACHGLAVFDEFDKAVGLVVDELEAVKYGLVWLANELSTSVRRLVSGW